MQTMKMKTEHLGTFLEALKNWGKLWAPVERHPGSFALERIEDVSRARPDALRTILPPKKLLLKPKFTMFESPPGGKRFRRLIYPADQGDS